MSLAGLRLAAAHAMKPSESDVNPEAVQLSRNGWVPNNERLPVLVYRNVIRPDGPDPAAQFESQFRQTGRPPQWRNGICDFHHFHSTAHEVRGFASGQATLLLGGPNGHQIEVHAGDAVVLRTGTGHCKLQASADFLVIGAYPPNQQWDICRNAPSDSAINRMHNLSFPQSDAVWGAGGPLTKLWRPAYVLFR